MFLFLIIVFPCDNYAPHHPQLYQVPSIFIFAGKAELQTAGESTVMINKLVTACEQSLQTNQVVAFNGKTYVW